MPHYTPLITSLVAAFCFAFALGALANRLRISPLVGYLLAGICVGPFTPGFVADQSLAPELAEIGVILLMFGVGLHFSLKDLLAVKGIAIPGALVQIGVATLLGMGLAHVLGWTLGAGLVFGLALSVASTVVLLRALEERRLLDSTRGRIAIGWLIVEDLVMVLVLVLLPALGELLGGGGAAFDSQALLLTLGITFGKVLAFLLFMLVVGRRVIPWLLARIARSGSRELFTLGVLAIALGVAYGSAHVFGVSFALGAFFAGMILGETELSHNAAADSLPLRDAFAVLFFVSVGMLFDPMSLLREPLPVLATCLIIVFGKSIAAWLIVRAFGHPNDTALTIAASLAQIGEFSFILAALGGQLGLLPDSGRDLILAGAILSILVNPLAFGLCRWLRLRLGTATQASDIPLPDLSAHADHDVLVGYGRVGSRLADELARTATPLVIVETRADLAEQARARGFDVLCGSAAAKELLEAAAIERARRLYIAIPQVFEAGEIVARARQLNPQLTIVARAHNESEREHLCRQGADHAVIGEHEIARAMSGGWSVPPALAG